jgi:hypothetical protein
MTVAPGASIFPVETCLIRFPSTRTLAFMIRFSFTPSNTLTLVNSVFGLGADCWANTGAANIIAAAARAKIRRFIS